MSWIKKISDGIQRAFSTVRKPLVPIPPILLMCGANKRTGMSAIMSTAETIRRMPEASIETGVNNCGSENMNNEFIRIICEEVIKEMKDNASVTCVIEQGKINSLGTGATASGPVVVTSINTIPSITKGIIQ
jgi:hypothetical protein